MEMVQCKPIVEKAIRRIDGVMITVSAQTSTDPLALWEIDCAVTNSIPIVGIDIRKRSEGNIPRDLRGKMTKFGWEWFAKFFNGL
jgi:hypothetical protein